MTYHTKEDERRLFGDIEENATRTKMLRSPIEPTNYYLFSFQIHNQTKDIFEVNAKLEKDKIVFEFKIDDKTQKELMKMFKERFKLNETK